MSHHQERNISSLTSNISTNNSSNSRNQEDFMLTSGVKRPRSSSADSSHQRNDSSSDEASLAFYCSSQSWKQAMARAQSHPEEASLDFKSNCAKSTRMSNSSPLAMACRYGAPPDCIHAILQAKPEMVQHSIPNRGTPLHEFIMTFPKENMVPKLLKDFVQVVDDLVRADQQLEIYSKRATLTQDVDGNVPLHLLIRQAFYNYVTADNYQNCRSHDSCQHSIVQILQNVIQASPQACAMPDFTEFEETPLVLVLKASIYSNDRNRHPVMQQDGNSQWNYNSHLELKIFEIVKSMLEQNPYSASFAASKSKHTAVHSAVFHGRCSDTLRLLLKADNLYRATTQEQIPSAAMRANKFGETPLHFAAMRGECTRTIDLLSKEAPLAVFMRDAKYGLTPLHWLTVRFIDIMVEKFGTSYDVEEEEDHVHHVHISTLDLEQLQVEQFMSTSGNANLKQDQDSKSSYLSSIDFDLEYHRRTEAIDPPVDYMRMRHILSDHMELEEVMMKRVSTVLKKVRSRHRRIMLQCMRFKENAATTSDKEVSACAQGTSTTGCPFHAVASVQDDDTKRCPFKCPFVQDSYPLSPELMGSEESKLREEQMISLFWAKVTSLLNASAFVQMNKDGNETESNQSLEVIDDETIFTLHMSCLPHIPISIVRLCMSLYPEQLAQRDSNGLLPLHHVAKRPLYAGEFQASRKTESTFSVTSSITNESSRILSLVLENSPREASLTNDSQSRLPFHYAIESRVTSFCEEECNEEDAFDATMGDLNLMIQKCPEVVEKKDGETGLYPFMQATAAASSAKNGKVNGSLALSVAYSLLLKNPSLAITHIS
ncbi:hypothetical protein CTEN210_18143 [Chaetoceros tenuissimus]|uniref:Uncharacterized protein n=1 Tax=Chaetoceros tenuissimus TaxID=426638 RepID=A0AAD3HF63_9STRA|nr:hypothetical protein CTEN210_18143 [Chaetoceros tenuissimus]